MHQLIYVSSAKELFAQQELFDLLKRSRDRNRAAGISGMLLHSSGNFMQVLEGDEAEVSSTFARISKDSRHGSVITLASFPIEERMFADWQMAFQEDKELKEDQRREVSRFFDEAKSAPEAERSRSAASLLLRGFVATMR